MEELTKKNGKGIWMRKIEKALRRFDASLEWLIEQIGLLDGEIEKIRVDRETEELEKSRMLGTKRLKSIQEVLEEVGVPIDTHFLDEFYLTKSSPILRRVFEN